jgi:MoaA/NifB/PqqE/SkfB family radical SAM enzyme
MPLQLYWIQDSISPSFPGFVKTRKLTDYTSLQQLASRQFVMLRGLNPRKMANAAGIYYEYRRKKVVLKHKPLLLKIEPSNHCNLRCPTCHPDGNTSGGTMDEETFRTILEKAPMDYFLKSTLYMFGEPLLNKRIYSMISQVSRYGIPTSISTNFHVFDEKRAEEMLASGLTWILVCIDGASQETYEIYRVGGDLEKVKENIRILVAEKQRQGSKYPVIEVQSVIFDHNRHEMDEIERMVLSLGADRFTTKEDVFTQLDYGDKELVPEEGKPKKGRSCFFLYGTFMVDYDGVVLPCCLGRSRFGDLKESSFEEIWNNEKFTAARRWFSSGFTDRDDDLDLPCYNCPLFM